jgi:membrane-associated phospholipid phosphatase
MPRRLLPALVALLGLAACGDASHAPTAPTAPDAARTGASSDAAAVTAAGIAAERVTAAALWNQRTRTILGRRGGSSNNAARLFALVSVAQYNAVIAAEAAKARGVHPSEGAAAAAAAATVLAARYAVERSFVEAQLAADAAYLATLPSERDADFAAGAAVGRAAAATVLAYAATDRSDAVWTGTIPAGPGYWTSTPPTAPPQEPLWGEIRPWLLSSAGQFRPAPPPAVGSPEFLAALAEVRSLSDARTPEQLAIAQYWASGYGAGGPAGYFGSVAAALAARRHLDERKTARLLAVMHMAIMDASIACYEAKYAYWYIRPQQADPAITVPVNRPNFPAYPSAHSCLSAAAAGVLAAFFPSEADDLHAMVEEAGVSRLYAGLHFRFDVTAGQELGYAVAELALRLAPDGHRPIPLD